MAEVKAAIVIQKNFRMVIAKIWFHRVIEGRHEAAARIQRNYKEYRRWRTIPKMLLMRKRNAAIHITKVMKGYGVRRVFYKHVIN